jgi:hypothetical protein
MWRGDDELEPVRRQTITENNVKIGLLTVNEGRVDMGREPYDNPTFDEPMFMTSNGLAPMIVNGQLNSLQGGPKDPAGTDPVETEEIEEEEAEVPDEPVEKVIGRLIENQDHAGLVNYLKSLEQGATS